MFLKSLVFSAEKQNQKTKTTHLIIRTSNLSDKSTNKKHQTNEKLDKTSFTGVRNNLKLNLQNILYALNQTINNSTTLTNHQIKTHHKHVNLLQSKPNIF
jgi:hypothetical protein